MSRETNVEIFKDTERIIRGNKILLESTLNSLGKKPSHNFLVFQKVFDKNSD